MNFSEVGTAPRRFRRHLTRKSCCKAGRSSIIYRRFETSELASEPFWLLDLCVRLATFSVIFSANGSAQDEFKSAYVMPNIAAHTAPVRAVAFSHDSSLLFTAGMDKLVHVWSLDSSDRLKRPTLRWERTLRREVARGNGGIILNLASHPKRHELIVGGFGARKNSGDLTSFGPDSGKFLTC